MTHNTCPRDTCPRGGRASGVRPILAAVALALLLVSCSAGGGAGSPPASESASAPAPPAAAEVSAAASPEPAATEVLAEPAATEETGPAATAAESHCLHGAWLANNEYFLASLREFGDEPASVAGEVTLTFEADGSVSTSYSGWRIAMLVEGREVTITREGTDVGTYVADQSQLSIHETDMGSTLTMSALGTEMTMPPEPANYVAAQYACDGSAASITTPDGTVILTR